MRSRFHNLFFITTTLLLSVTSPLSAVTPNFKPLVALVQTVQERQAEADRLLEEANSQFSEGQFQKALESFQQILSRRQILSIYREIGYRRQEKDLTFMIGLIYGQLGQYNQSLKYFQQTLALDRELGNRCQEQEILFGVSLIYGVLGQYDQVLEGLENSLGFVYRKLGQSEKSQEFYELALKRYQQKFTRIKEKEKSDNCWLDDELRIPREIAQIYEILGEVNLARDFYRQAEKLEFVQDFRGEVCVVLGEVASGIVLTDDDDTSPPSQSK